MPLGYLSPSGKFVIKKNWQADLVKTQKEVTINNGHFVKQFKNLLIKENPYLKHLELKAQERQYNREYKLTKQTRYKLLNALYVCIETMQYKLYMITLTYPKWDGTEEENDHIKDFTKSLNETYGVKKYFWVKEIQEKRSAREKILIPHFHIICDIKFFDVNKLRNRWYSIIGQHSVEKKHGLNFKYCHEDEYGYNRTKHEMLNYLAKYLSKYCSKTDRTFKSKAYEISYAINLPVIPVIKEKTMRKTLKNIRGFKNNTENGVKHGEYYDFAYVENKQAVKLYKRSLVSLIKCLKSSIRKNVESRKGVDNKEIKKKEEYLTKKLLLLSKV